MVPRFKAMRSNGGTRQGDIMKSKNHSSDEWILFDLIDDREENKNQAAQYPEKLNEYIKEFYFEGNIARI